MSVSSQVLMSDIGIYRQLSEFTVRNWPFLFVRIAA